jgi:hypothetical protein
MDVHVDNFGSCCAVVVVMQALRPSFLNGLPVYLSVAFPCELWCVWVLKGVKL